MLQVDGRYKHWVEYKYQANRSLDGRGFADGKAFIPTLGDVKHIKIPIDDLPWQLTSLEQSPTLESLEMYNSPEFTWAPAIEPLT